MPYQSWHSDKAITQTNTERVRRIITVLLPFRKITERKEVAVFMQYGAFDEYISAISEDSFSKGFRYALELSGKEVFAHD